MALDCIGDLAAIDWSEGNTSPAIDEHPVSDGIEGRIAQHVPLAEDGTLLGFEVICFGYNDFQDSWYCNGKEGDLERLFGIQPGGYGLIQTREEAKQVNDWIAENPSHRGEPLPYAYWLLVSYPVSIY